MTTYKLQISGMSCAACSNRIEKVLNKMDGVQSARINLASEQGYVDTNDQNVSLPDIIQRIEKIGFQAEEIHAIVTAPKQSSNNAERLTMWVCAILTLPLVLPMIFMPFGMDLHLSGWAQLCLATPVQLIAVWRFYPSAWGALRGGSGNMDLLVAMGTTAAFGLSLYVLLTSHRASNAYYFEAAAAITSLILLGKYLESRAKHGVNAAIRALMKLTPETATRLNGTTQQVVPVNEITADDLVLVKPGEKIAIDGLVIEGKSEVDESLLTGEPLPQLKETGSTVTGGAINGTGQLIVQATTVGEFSTLNQIIELIQGAQASKAPIQKLADKISGIFVPVVISLSFLTFIGWYINGTEMEIAILNAITVLVIACPCALGLATPSAIIAGTGVAAKHGILIKDAQALETAHRVTHVIFDKTGTLTHGTPKLMAQWGQGLNIAASLQQASEHPIAHAFPKEDLKSLQDFQAVPGAGVEGCVDGVIYRLGNQKLIKNDISASTHFVNECRDKGWGVVWLENDNEVIDAFAIGDEIRDSAKTAIETLHHAGVQTSLLSGDNKTVAETVGKKVGICDITSDVVPAQKASHIESLKNRDRTVAMVGDGINDAPALATADIGFAMSSGADIAMQSAPITLMRTDPRLVATAIAISKVTYRKIQQNLFWAFVYNVIALPLAAFGLLNPVIAGAAMAFSSLSVVSNALLLKRWKE